MGLGFRCVGTWSAHSVPRPVQRALPDHGVGRFVNGGHATNAPRNGSRLVLWRAIALRGLACSCSLDNWCGVDRVVWQSSLRYGTRELWGRLAGRAFNVCCDCMDSDLEATDAAAF